MLLRGDAGWILALLCVSTDLAAAPLGAPSLLCSLPRLTSISLIITNPVWLQWDMCKWMDLASPRKGASHRHISHRSWFSHQVRFVVSCQHKFAEIGKDKTAKYALMVVLNKENSSHLSGGLCPLSKVHPFLVFFPLTDHRSRRLCNYFILLFKVTWLECL